ncbi:hypothetical protein V8B55DRAFT_1548854 [Mucor lusitanicus]|uniref:BTB domain-containing protein n=2 Tax=Mucor circinelloides f. lusitanicus TaxID=29924 RepID=A0A162TSE3_MUCCL|nr:hypothetical protein FB192DRAFT_1396093 [Mucor lusitanicus]OAD06752.1 hypothetical protein MUCCIDRAFT_78219 [Mucor lusitanicus CBS 277.49]
MTKDFEVVKLDVGGKPASTYYDTLKTSTYFQELIKNKEGEQAIVIGTADEPTYFIDRDGHVFQKILHYLRSYSIRKKGQDDLKKLRVEATFFKFDALVKEIDRTLEEADDQVTYHLKDTFGDANYIKSLGQMNINIDAKTDIVSKVSYKGPNGIEQNAFIQKSSKQR